MYARETAAAGNAHLEVLKDREAVRESQARGENPGARWLTVIRDENGRRRVVRADEIRHDRLTGARRVVVPTAPPRRPKTGGDRAQRRLQQIECDMAAQRDRRLAQLQAEVSSDAARLAREDFLFASKRMSPTLLPAGIRRIRMIS